MTTKTVVGHYEDESGTPYQGHVSFRPTIARFINNVTHKIVPAVTLYAPLDASGNISIVLQATNDPQIQGQPFQYIVSVVLLTGPGFQFMMNVDKDAVGSIDISSLTPEGANPPALDLGATPADITAAIATHDTATDPHTAYQLKSAKDQANGYAGLDSSSKVLDAKLPTTMDSKTLTNATLNATNLTSGTVADARLPSTMDAKTLTNAVLNATNLTSGTVADARLPSTMDAKTLTNAVLNATNLTSGTVADARLPATMDSKTLTNATLNATNLTSGTVADARLPSTMASKTLTSAVLNASDLSSGTVADARLPSTMAGKTLTTATLTAPTMADFTNAGHAHTGASSGGVLSASAIASGSLAIARLPQSDVELGSDLTGLTSTSFAVLTGLSTTLGVGTWMIEADLVYTLTAGGTAPTVGFGVNFGGTQTFMAQSRVIGTGVTNSNDASVEAAPGNPGFAVTVSSTTSQNRAVTIRGRIKVTVSGTFDIRYIVGGTVAPTMTVKAGSAFGLRQVA